MRYGGPWVIKEGRSGLKRSYSVAEAKPVLYNNEPDSSAPHQTKNTPPSFILQQQAGTFLMDVTHNVSHSITTLSNLRALTLTFTQSLIHIFNQDLYAHKMGLN